MTTTGAMPERTEGDDSTPPPPNDGGRKLAIMALVVMTLLAAVFLALLFLERKELGETNARIASLATKASLQETDNRLSTVGLLADELNTRVNVLGQDVVAANTKAAEAEGLAKAAKKQAADASKKAADALKKASAALTETKKAKRNAGAVPAVVHGTVLPEPVVPSGAIWLWHHHQATEQDKRPCIISAGDGAGLPPYCSGSTLEVKRPGEEKFDWLKRVGGGGDPSDTGTYQKPGHRP